MEKDNSKQWKVIQEWREKGGSVQSDSEMYGIGKRFFSVWHDTSIMTDEEMRSFGRFLYEKANSEVQEKWGKVIEHYATHWGAYDKLLNKQGKKIKNYEKMEDDKVSRMIACWEMSLQWLGPLGDYRSLIKLWLAFSEEMVNKLLAKNNQRNWIEEMLKIWPHFCWNLREQIHKQKFMALSVKPGFLTILRMHRVKILWASGRARYYNRHSWAATDYTQTFGAALDTLLDESSLSEEDEQQDRVDFAVLMVMSLCGKEGEKLLLEAGAFEKFDVQPLEGRNFNMEMFILMAPSLAKHAIKILSLISTEFANDSLFPGGIERIMLILLQMLGACSTKALPSVGRITDYLTEQCSKNNNWLIKLVCDNLDAFVLRRRFVTDDNKEGLNSIAGRLLKIMLMTMKADDAKGFVELMLDDRDSHLSALEEVVLILEDACARPSSKSSKLKTGEKEFTIITAWVGGAEKFKERLAAGGEVSSEKNSCDMRIVKNFLCLPFRVKKMDQIETGAFKADFTKLLPAMSRAWKELYLAVRSGAALVRGFNSDDLNVDIGTVIGEEGVKNYQLATPLSFILNMLAASESKKIFDNAASGDQGSEFTKFSQLVINILDEATGRPLENFSYRGTVSALKIMQKLIDNHGEKAVMVLGNIITEFAKVALANKKSLMWTNATDRIMDVLEAISTANKSPAKTFPGLEPLFSLLLSKKSVHRVSEAVGECWQASFLVDHDQLDMSENFWQLIQVHYISGDWDPPTKYQSKLATASMTSMAGTNQSSSVAAAMVESEKGPSTPVRGAQQRKLGTPQRKNGTPQRRNGTPQRNGGTPQRYNRQLAALQGATQGSPKTPPNRRRGAAGIMSSTVRDNGATAEFTLIDSPITFNKKNLTAAQREKMKEKKAEEQVGTALYNHVDDSQSRMSQYLGADSNTQASDTATQGMPNRKASVDIEHMDESAMDGTSFLAQNPSAHSTVLEPEITMKQSIPPKGESTKIAPADESNLAAVLPKIDESISETTLPAPPVPPMGNSTKIARVDESNMTINKTCDMTAGIGLQGMPESSFEETMETSECNATAEVDNCRANDRTMDVTAGIGCQMTFVDSSMDESMAAATMTKLPTPKPPRSERTNDEEVETNAESKETDTAEKKSFAFACPEPCSSEIASDSMMSEEGSSRVLENEKEETTQESKDDETTDEQQKVSPEKKALPKPVATPEKQALPKPLSPKKPESNEADSDVLEVENPSTASMYDVDEDAEASTLDEGSLTPDPVVDLISPDRTAGDYSVIILDDTVAEGSAERKKRKAARKLDMTPPTSPDRRSKLAMETSPKKLSSSGKDASEEKNTTDMSMSPEVSYGTQKTRSLAEAKEEESKKRGQTLAKTWKDEFGHDVPYLKNDPRRPKNQMELLDEEVQEELGDLLKSESEGEAERDALLSPASKLQKEREAEAKKNQLLNRSLTHSTGSKDPKSAPIMKRKRSSEGSRPSKKHRVSFIDEQFSGPEIRRIPSNSSLPGSSSPTALRRRPSSESVPSPRSEKSLTRAEKMLMMARPEGSPRMRPLPVSIPEPTANDREAAYNAIKEAINANIENVTDEDRLSLITRISRRKRRTSSSNLGQS